LHGYLADLPPVEFNGRFYATQQGDKALVRNQTARALIRPGRFRRSLLW
jgi:hypothetical protein